jgi:hypothetical protein
MLTLTLPAGGYSGVAGTRRSIRDASKAWNVLRGQLVREFGAAPFFRGLELTQRGVAHLHVVTRVRSKDHYWRLRGYVRANVVGSGFGPNVKVDLARSRMETAKYVSKAEGVAAYVSKGVGQRMPRYARRASWSRDWTDWVKPTPVAGFSWELHRHAPDLVLSALRLSEFVVVDPSSWRIAPSGDGPREGPERLA